MLGDFKSPCIQWNRDSYPGSVSNEIYFIDLLREQVLSNINLIPSTSGGNTLNLILRNFDSVKSVHIKEKFNSGHKVYMKL